MWKACRHCHKVWSDEGEDGDVTNLKAARIQWCGVCTKKLMAEFERQFAPSGKFLLSASVRIKHAR